jgi:hypothetical protein
MIPIMLIFISLMELSNINFRIGSNVISYRQAQYNAETGLIFGKKKLEANSYNESFSQYNKEKYIIFDNATSVADSQNYSETYISYSNNIFTITSKGHYRRFVKTKIIQINRNAS